MIKVGLTGNYYSGQNEVSEIFEKLNVKVFDADLILKYMINFSENHVKKIQDSLGSNVYQMGLLNMNKMKTNQQWNELIDLLEFDIIKSYEKFRLNHKDDFFTIFKYSYLFERDLNTSMDKVICCYRPKYQRRVDLKRLTFMSDYEIENLLNNEMDELIKNNKSSYIINNFESNDSDIRHTGLDFKVNNIHKILSNKKPHEKIMGSEYEKYFSY